MVALPYLFYPATSAYQECLRGANTVAAQSECGQHLDEGLVGLFEEFLSR